MDKISGEEVYLGFLYKRIRGVNKGALSYLLTIEEIRLQLIDCVNKGVTIDENRLLDIIRSVYDKKINSSVKDRSFSLSQVRRAIKGLEKVLEESSMQGVRF